MAKILLIEDDKDQIMLYQFKFEQTGHTFIFAKNGQTGLEMAEKEQPDMILIDLLMPHMDGIEVLEKLRQNPKTKDLQAIIITNLEKKEPALKAKSLGALDVIIKSKITLNEMVTRVIALIKK